jgi:hypothetical protein
VTTEATHTSMTGMSVNPVADLPLDTASQFVATVDQVVCDLPFLPTQVRLRAHHALRC